MWWYVLIEAVFWMVFGTSESRTWKRWRFRKRYGIEYDAVLGREIQGYLNSIHNVPKGWSWELSVDSADKAAKTFRVKYDDCGGRSGIVEVGISDSSPSYQRITPEQGTGGNAI